ncbi:hypothetical protein T484DRAFT_1837706 [Baffinella frigidus]|nr:hypothetical protein T484DRAFT_1837706 [Cryptophyta sp. CCMP2293]
MHERQLLWLGGMHAAGAVIPQLLGELRAKLTHPASPHANPLGQDHPDEEMPALEDEEETTVETTVGVMQKGASEAA